MQLRLLKRGEMVKRNTSWEITKKTIHEIDKLSITTNDALRYTKNIHDFPTNRSTDTRVWSGLQFLYTYNGIPI